MTKTLCLTTLVAFVFIFHTGLTYAMPPMAVAMNPPNFPHQSASEGTSYSRPVMSNIMHNINDADLPDETILEEPDEKRGGLCLSSGEEVEE